MMRPVSAHLNETTRLAQKKRPIGRSPRAWANLLYCAPGMLLVRLLEFFGYDVALYPDHFGHQAIDVEHHLRSLDGRRHKALYLCGNVIPNGFLFEKHRNLLHALSLPPGLMRYARAAEKTTIRRFGRSLFYSVGLEEKMADAPLWNSTEPKIIFSDAEHQKGRAILLRMGLTPGTYVCLHARDPAYALLNTPKRLAEQGVADAISRAVAQEGSLFNRYRNFRFADFTQAIGVLAQHGLRAVRLGADADATGVADSPYLVDYANVFRSKLGNDAAFADAYLMAHCRFYVGGATGVTAFAFVFNRPIVFVNSFPWPWSHFPPFDGSIYLPKLLRRKDGLILSFAEIFSLSRRHDWRAMYDDAFFDAEQIEALDNTPEELAAAVQEMCERQNGALPEDAADEDRQQKLLQQAGESIPLSRTPSRMARQFLAAYQSLLTPPRPGDAFDGHVKNG